jgi:diguanylate cyclase (GGDEF)-like protein
MNARMTKYRFLVVVMLLAIPSVVFGWLFVSQSQRAITVATTERAGIEYLRAVIPLFEDLAGGSASTEIDYLTTFNAVSSRMDPRFGSSPLSNVVKGAVTGQSVDPEAVRYALLALISAISDKSGLTIDPEIDSYYLIQTMIFQTPRVIASIDALSQMMSTSQAVPAALSESASSIFLETMRLEDALKGMRQTYKHALAANLDGSLERKLSSKVELAMRSVHLMSISGHRVRASLLDGQFRNSEHFVPTDGKAEKKLVIQAWSAMSDNLERLIKQRLDGLRGERNLALQLSSIAAVVVFFIGLSVFRSLIVELDQKIVFLAHHDAMTRLKNRAAFSAEMSNLINGVQANGGGFAIHAVDLDGFKAINDTLGHHVGDQVLQDVAVRLLALASKGDVVGRRGGDEFVVLQNGYTAGSVEAFSRRILKAMRDPLVISDKPVGLSASIGTAIYGHHGDSESKLMQAADFALYEAKRLGKDQACLFDTRMEAEQRQKVALEERVREAAARFEFALAYQPQFSSDGSKITGFEALLRMNDHNGQAVSPVAFIPVLESLGLIAEVGRWVLLQACKTAAKLPEDIIIAANVSPLQLSRGRLVGDVSHALTESGLMAERLQLEITESAVLEDTTAVLDELNELKALGVSIAMDDFGTGYSGLSSLWKFPFDKVKIDKSFLSDRTIRGRHALDTIGSIIDFAHALSMSVTVEGVETQSQAIKMAELDCDQLQGFYFSKPIHEADLPSFILSSLSRSRVVSDETFDHRSAI